MEIGQEVAVRSGYNDGYLFGLIAKITPSGQVVVKLAHRDVRFDKRGIAMDGRTDSYHSERLEVDVVKAREEIRVRGAKIMAAKAIYDVRVEDSRSTYSKETMEAQIAELTIKLNDARQAVAQI